MFENLGDIGSGLGQAAKAAGKGTAKLITNVGSFASKHPVASSRIYGASQILKGVRDLKDFKETRSRGSLITGIGRLILGGALVIYNDRAWYEKYKKISPALNTGRPMNPLLLKDFTIDATIAGITKFVDIEMDWDSLEGSLLFDSVATRIMQAIRESLRSNLVYDDVFVRHYLNDAINLTIWMLQIQTQMTWRDLASPDNPTAYNLVNKIATESTSYGPVTLEPLAHYASDVGADVFATTIAQYNTAVSYLNNNAIYLPGNVPEFLNFYFGNVYSTDSDGKNTQLMFPRVRTVRIWNQDDTHLQSVDITTLDPADILVAVRAFTNKYAVLMADLTKTTNFRAIGFVPYEDLAEVAVYSPEFLQMIINAYSDNRSVLNNGFIRFDYIDENIDILTTFMATRPLLDERSPLFTPSIRIKSMVAKFESDPDLLWDTDLFQGPFNTNQDFGIAITSSVNKDIYVNVQQSSTTLVAGTPAIINYTGDLTPQSVDVHLSTTGNNYYTDGYPTGTNYGSGAQATDQVIWPIFTYSEDTTNRVGRVCFAAIDVQDTPLNFTFYTCTLDDYTAAAGNTHGSPVLIRHSDLTNHFHATECTAAPANWLIPQQIDRDNFGVYWNTSNDVTFSITTTSKYFAFINALNSNISYSSLAMHFTEGTISSVGVTSGFISLDSFIADQLDYHMPMTVTTTQHTTVNDDATQDTLVGISLIKENYIPFMYNVIDLVPVLYDMFYSLFLPAIKTKTNNNTNKNKNKNKNKNNKDSKPSAKDDSTKGDSNK